MAYMAGQIFGAGVAAPPAGVGAAQAVFAAVFANTDLSNSARAQQVAQATWTLALTSIVAFPPVISPPSPVM